MKIISTKEYNKLMKMKSDYLDLLWKPLQGAFEKVTDDDLLRENGLLNAENERLNKENTILRQNSQYLVKQNDELEEIINNAIEYIEENKTHFEDNLYCFDNMLEDVIPLLSILKGVDKE